MKELLDRILTEPSPDALWQLHPRLLALDSPDARSARELARQFYGYLSCVRSKLTSKQFSALGARLAASSIGVIAVENVVEAMKSDRANTLSSLLAGGLAATLETLSTFQHVKAWETEFTSVHEEAVWHLYAEYWRLSADMQPDLASEKRQELLDSLLAAARSLETSSVIRMGLIIRLYQIMLAFRLVPLISSG
ncbi:MAG: hypothetical protein JW966_16630 [Anaerolineae bacterium]|nr:hypothetical protein [Anaerolineae bacterium]